MSNAEVLGRFIWHELLTTDTAAAAAFYPKVVPWRTAPSNMPGYTIWMAGQTQIGGLMAHPGDGGAGTPAHWLTYIGTPGVDATCAQAQALGAKVVKPPADIPNVGRFAVLTDPQGAAFAVFTPGAGPPPAASQGPGTFSWHELATTDVAAALRFYGELFGWRKGAGHDMGGGMGTYQIFEHGGRPVGGMHAVQGPSTPPSWLSYVQVAAAERAVTAVKAAGGRLLHGPMEVPGGSRIALFMDPQGGAFAVQELPQAVAQTRPAASAKAAAAAKPAAGSKPAAKPPAAAKKQPAPKKPAPKKKVRAKRPAKAAKKKSRKVAKKAARRPAKRGTRRPVRRTARRGARRAPARRRARGRRR
ncbi:MAG TPA: VOC family protein [Steroidobacteraceae bacterium]|jgi:predicted enzyme related to lactoylglutathione lyase|nr:VOC family protein [Steroidobacteraceae bacterium]